MQDTVLLTYAAPPRLTEALAKRYTVLGPMASMSPGDLPSGSQQVRAMVTKGGLPIGPELLDALPALEIILCYGTGYDLIDLQAAKARGIRITNAGDANAAAVAEFAITLMLAGVRQLLPYDRMVRSDNWTDQARSAMCLSPGLVGRRLGIYGLGAIGRQAAKRAQALDMEVGYCGRAPHADSPFQWYPSVQALAEWADVLLVSVRAGSYNRHAIDKEVLKALGQQGFLVNISRGYVVNEADLIEALAEDVIAGAGLDVFEHEPLVPEALRNDDRVLLAPHIAPHTDHAQNRMRDCLLANLDAFFKGASLTGIIV